ncbi:MAG: outer membrane beta-barrel protein [Candidatus Paracaedibacteraceae bacterium]|nr:outer membrane beta-barrel protein [Candidatus Paracaedibacteraceae bacterium]
MKKYFFLLTLFLLPSTLHAGKFDGISVGAGIGANTAALKEKSTPDSLKQFGANGKIYVGVGKNFLDLIFIGAEGFGRYSFFVKQPDTMKENVEGAPQFGGYIKAGIRPTENLLIYALYGFQTNTVKIKNAFNNLFEPTDGTLNSMVGLGCEYAFALGAALRVEGVYEPEIPFKIKDVPHMEYNTSFFSINLGLVLYL